MNASSISEIVSDFRYFIVKSRSNEQRTDLNLCSLSDLFRDDARFLLVTRSEKCFEELQISFRH